MQCEAIWLVPTHDISARHRSGERCPHEGKEVELHPRTNRWLCWLHRKAVDNLDRTVPVRFVASKASVPRRADP